MNEVKIVDETLVFECPHCNEEVIVLRAEINCAIFRHGVIKHNFEQVNPHLPKHECDKLFAENIVYGCCKPFEIIIKDDKYYVVQCEYK